MEINNLIVAIPMETKRKFKAKVARQGKLMKEVLKEFIEDYIRSK